MTTSNTEKKRLITDAHEPNAGTDFHVLWCIERALSLLSFKENHLTLITVESLTAKDQVEVDPDGDKMLAADLCEYYNGEDIASASHVVISQLKYSTKHSQTEWTVAKICAGKKAGGKGSIIDRFAATFKAIDGSNQIDKLQIKLISNRPASKGVKDLVKYAQDTLAVGAVPAIINKSLKEDLKRVQKVTDLNDCDLLKFISKLNFEDCNASSRALLRTSNIEKIAELGIQECTNQLAVLEAFVRKKSYPESKKSNSINKSDVLLEFGIPTYESIFPVDNNFKEGPIIHRTQAEEIYRTIEQSKSLYPFCVHGPAGIGKTTFIQQIRNSNPGNIFILFDCYGGGAYLDPEDLRHRHKYGLLALCNEIAKQMGTPLLLSRGADEDFYLKEFSNRVKLASHILEETRPGRRIFICIDAADNSISAADRSGERDFVSDIIKMRFPGNVKVIISTRTARKSFLEVNEEISYFELQPFTEQETDLFLKLHNIGAENSAVQELHKLSGGIPRVISYTLRSTGDTLADKIEHLKPDGRDLDNIFKSIVEEAALRSGNRNMFKNVTKLLIELPRPIPLTLVAQILENNHAFCEDVIIDLSSGIKKNENHIHFNDEDFEVFLENWTSAVQPDYDIISNVLLSNADQDEYSSTHLGRYLGLAGKHEELRRIVLDRSYLKKPEDHYKNVKVFLGRAKLAMKHAAAGRNPLEYAKLQAITAEASASNQILENIVLNNAELGAIFIYDTTKDRRHSASPSEKYLGSYYLRTSAVLSRNSKTIEPAKALLGAANSWINKWKTENSPDNDYLLEPEDISYGIEATLRIHGFWSAVDWSYRWTSKTMMFELLYHTTIRILNHSEDGDIEQWKKELVRLRADIKMEVYRAFIDTAYPIQVGIEDVAILLRRLHTVFGIRDHRLKQIICFVIEQLFEKRAFEKATRDLIEILKQAPPIRIPSFGSSLLEKQEEDAIVNYIKYYAFVSCYEKNPLESKDLLPKEDIERDDKKGPDPTSEEERRKLICFYEIMLPLLELKLSAIVGKPKEDDLNKIIFDLLSKISYPYDFPGRFGDRDQITLALCNELFPLINLFVNRELFFDTIKEHALRLASNTSNLLLYLARKAAGLKEFKLVERFLMEADKEESTKIQPGSEAIDFYTKATVIAHSVSFALSKIYFTKLVKATEDIDMEVFDRIRLLASVAPSVPSSHNCNWDTAWKFAKYVEYCSIKLSSYEDFPWKAAVEAIAKLDPMAVLPVICNWDHISVREVNSSLLETLTHLLGLRALKKESISALITCQNLYWQGYVDIIDRLLSLYVNDPAGKRRLLDFIFQDYAFEMNNNQQHSLLPEITSVLEKHNLKDTRTVKKMKCYEQWMNARVEQHSNAPLSRKASDAEPAIVSLDVSNKESFENFLHNLKERYFSTDEKKQIVNQTKTLGYEKFIDFVEILLGVDKGLIPFFYYAEIIEESIALWISYTEVKAWVSDNFPRLLTAQDAAYLKIGYYEKPDQLYRLKLVCGISDENFHKTLLDVMPSVLENLSGSELYRLLELTAAGMDDQLSLQFTDWLISLWSQKINTDFDRSFPSRDSLNRTEDAVLTGLYRYLLGHPDKRVRWRAARSVCRIVSYGHEPLIGMLLKEQNATTCEPFSLASEPFYWLASKTWLWIALHKISSQKPSILIEHLQYIKAEFLAPGLPHAQILWFVKATCLNLEKAIPGTFEQSELALLNSIFESTHGKQVGIRSPIKQTDTKHRFKFDYLDTVEYWFKGLGRCFGISANEVAEVVDEILIDEWLVPSELPKVRNTDGYNYDLTSHRKFERPVVEPYQTYLEFNGMQCAAMRLLKKHPVVRENEDDWRTWPYWLSEQGLLWDSFWLSDMKDPVPPEKSFWQPESVTNDWKYGITFEMLFTLPRYGIRQNNSRAFIIREYSTIHWGKSYESRTIGSVLVHKSHSLSALLTCQTRRDPYSYHFETEHNSEEGEEDRIFHERSPRYNTDIGREGLYFIPTIKVLDPERNSIDEFDPLIKGMYKGRWVLSSAFSNNRCLETSPDRRLTWEADTDHDFVSIAENWSNTPEKEGYSENYSSGTRLYIREDWLLHFLKEHELSLLLQTEIYRYQDGKENSYEHTEYALYHLIHSDGTIQTISGNFSIGEAPDPTI